MSTPRLAADAAVLGGNIYVVGGCYGGYADGVQELSSVESFDPATGIWTAVAPMNAPRSGHGVVSAQGKLFAAGGFTRDEQGVHKTLSSVECFDPSTGVWTTINPMNGARVWLGLAVLGDKLFVIGGMDMQDGKGKLSSVECLELSVPNGAWKPVAPMTMPRSQVGVAVMGGKIYAMGGPKDNARTSMECFDPNEEPPGRWTLVTDAHMEPSMGAKYSAL